MATTTATPDADMKTFISNLPKAELHMHLEGALEPSLVHQIAQRNNVPLPASCLSASRDNTGWEFHDLTSFLSIYYPNMAVLLTSTDFFDLAWSYLVKCHEQHVVHTEMFFDPQAHTSRGVPFSTVIMGYRQAIIRAERELGISAQLIMCFLRDLDPRWAMDTLMQALPYKDYIVGVGLDSDERDNAPVKFKEVFERARTEGFLLTMHCDIDQKDSVEHIRQVLEVIQVDRIDHGTNIVEDEALVELVRKKGIGLTCCPVSNSVVTRDFKGKEIVGLLRRGVKCTVNSDDPAYFRGYMNENLEKMVEADVSKEELVLLEKNAFEVSWLSTKKRDGFLDILEEYAKRNDVQYPR